MHKQKFQTFRKQIRKGYINEMFQKKRKQLFQDQQHMHNESQRQEAFQQLKKKQFNNQNGFTIKDLQIMASLSQTQIGVNCLLKTNYPTIALQYLQSDYYDTEAQRNVACMFANITFIKQQKCPSFQFMTLFTQIIVNCKAIPDIVDSSLLVIFNLLCQFREAVQFYLKKVQLLKTLYSIMDNGPQTQIIPITLRLLYFISKKEGQLYGKQLRKFLKFFLSIITATNDSQIFEGSLRNIQCILEHYNQLYVSNKGNNNITENQSNEQLTLIKKQVINSCVMPRIIKYFPLLCPKYDNYSVVFNIIQIVLDQMKIKTIEDYLFPFIEKVSYTNKLQQIGKQPFQNSQSKMEQERNQSIQYYLKVKSIQTVYWFLRGFNDQIHIFRKSKLFKKMLSEFQEEQDKQLLKNYVYVFGILAFGENINQQEKEILKRAIHKIQSLRQNDSNLDQFIQSVHNYAQLDCVQNQ